MTRKEKLQMERDKIVSEKGIICLEDVFMEYSSGTAALNGVSINIKQGEFVFIVGASGSGKSTLIKLLLREIVATGGDVIVKGINLRKLRHRQVPKFRRNLGVVFQNFRLLKDRNVFENVAFAQRIVEVPASEIRKNVSAILATVDLSGKYKSEVDELSGGEQQRVAMARALVNKPSILLADEPTGNLDQKNSWEIMKLLEEINEAGTTVVVVTHNEDIVRRMNRRVIAMRRGVVAGDFANAAEMQEQMGVDSNEYDDYYEDEEEIVSETESAEGGNSDED